MTSLTSLSFPVSSLGTNNRAMAAITTSRRLIEGPLSKWTNVVNGWQYRWFVLDQNTGLLSYYTSKDKMKRGSRRGCFQLKRSIIGIDDEDDCTFTIRVDSRTYHFQAQDSKEREQWVHALESCMRRLQQPIRPGDEALTSQGGPTPHHLEVMLPESNSSLSLDQRMAETEAYYHLMHDQLDAISEKLNSSEEASQIKQTAKTMLEALQQCIDLMKDAQLSEGDSSRSPSCEQEAVEPEATQDQGNTSPSSAVEEVIQNSDEDESESSESTDSDINVSSDEYFDADTELGILPLPGLVVTSPSVSIPPPAEGDPSDIEEDDEFTEDNDTSNAVAENKSLIMHMLSQVRLGMDLTRIVLPTFILEKRSLLEMYAEFFAHPDLFASIPDHRDAKDRMIASVRYYLSSFHSARKGMVAKKPYNPILGEIFRCYWDLPNSTRIPPDENAKIILDTGPVPYASYNSVTFAAEQVSHHPPISALYAECPAKRMYVHGHLWTKSKFLGLSLGVHNIGDVHLHLLDYGEEYVCTMPNAYGRSILTIPWLELGGKCQINCAQTGFYAEVEFHCKPFYGGKKHRVTADLYHVSDKKPFMKVEGEWNGVMYIKHPNGDREVFMDTLNSPTIRKKLQKLSSQDPGESRYRWRHVTEALSKKDVEAASEGKHMLEEKQRADAKERQQLGIEWKQKLFHAVGDVWMYNEPLKSRLEQHT